MYCRNGIDWEGGVRGPPEGDRRPLEGGRGPPKGCQESFWGVRAPQRGIEGPYRGRSRVFWGVRSPHRGVEGPQRGHQESFVGPRAPGGGRGSFLGVPIAPIRWSWSLWGVEGLLEMSGAPGGVDGTQMGSMAFWVSLIASRGGSRTPHGGVECPHRGSIAL